MVRYEGDEENCDSNSAKELKGPYREERNPKNCERKLMGEGIFRILSAVRKEIRRRAPRVGGPLLVTSDKGHTVHRL